MPLGLKIIAGIPTELDAVLVILGYVGDPSQIVPLPRKPNRFRRGELWRLIQKLEAEGSASNRETAIRIVAMRGWDSALVKPIMDWVKTAKGGGRRRAEDHNFLTGTNSF